MTKKSSKAVKKVTTKKATAPIKPVEEVTVEKVKDTQVEEAQKTGEYPPKPIEETLAEKPIDKNPEPITLEIVEEEKEKKEEDKTPVPSISAGLSKLANGDRLDHNRSVELMKMVNEAYVNNPATPPELARAMKKQFDAMALVELMFYNAQLEADFQQLGIKVTKDQFTEIERIARETFGISLKGLPESKDSKQLVINFSESIPEPIKKQVAEDKKAQKKVPVIPEPNINMPLTDKMNTLRSILSHIGDGIGNNVDTAIEWSRKAFGYTDNEKKAVILANILKHDPKTTLINGITGMVKGKFGSEHSLFGVHAVLHSWLPRYTDQEIAEIVQTCLSYKEELNVREMNERQGGIKSDINNCLALINRDVVAGRADKVIDAIIKGKENVVVEYKDKVGQIAINTGRIRKSLVTVYGDSDNILKDKLKEIAKYYVRPIMRFASYEDKSAFSTALA